MFKNIFIASVALLIAGCAATPINPEAQKVEIHVEKPTGTCKQLGETAGSQGGYLIGDYTSDKNLMVGARNDLRNNAAAMGGNYVWLQNTSNSSAYGSGGTTSTTVIGMVYHCQ